MRARGLWAVAVLAASVGLAGCGSEEELLYWPCREAPSGSPSLEMAQTVFLARMVGCNVGSGEPPATEDYVTRSDWIADGSEKPTRLAVFASVEDRASWLGHWPHAEGGEGWGVVWAVTSEDGAASRALAEALRREAGRL